MNHWSCEMVCNNWAVIHTPLADMTVVSKSVFAKKGKVHSYCYGSHVLSCPRLVGGPPCPPPSENVMAASPGVFLRLIIYQRLLLQDLYNYITEKHSVILVNVQVIQDRRGRPCILLWTFLKLVFKPNLPCGVQLCTEVIFDLATMTE